jgi:hypothetical protein
MIGHGTWATLLRKLEKTQQPLRQRLHLENYARNVRERIEITGSSGEWKEGIVVRKGKKLPCRQLVEFTVVLRSSIKQLELSQAIMDAIPSSPIPSTSKVFFLKPISEKTARRRCATIKRKPGMLFYELILYSTEDSTLGLSGIPSSDTPQTIKEFLLSVVKQKWTVERYLLSILKHEENKHEQNEGWVKALRKSWEDDMARKPKEGGTQVCEALASSVKKAQWTDEHHPNQAEADFLFGDGPIPPEFSALRSLHREMGEEDWLVFPRSWTWGDERDWLVTDEQRLRMRRWRELRRQAKVQWETRHNRSRQDEQYPGPKPHPRKK